MDTMWKELNIANLPRLTRFPFQVQLLGYTHGGIYPGSFCNYDKYFEICIRRYSRAKEARETINGIEYRVNFPNVVVKAPGMEHIFLIDEPRETLHFKYDGSLKEELYAMLPFPDKPIWEVPLNNPENRLITELTDLMEKSLEYGVTDRIDLAAFHLLELLIFSYNAPARNPDYYETRIRSIASYFQLHYLEEINIENVAAYHGMSRSTFLRHWQRFFKKTPGQFLLELKLQEACRLLKESRSLSVSRLTGVLGFKDPAYFCALFKKKYGITPLQYRNGRIHLPCN